MISRKMMVNEVEIESTIQSKQSDRKNGKSCSNRESRSNFVAMLYKRKT